MEALINKISKMNLNEQHIINKLITADLQAIAKAIINSPNEINISLIEFPPMLSNTIEGKYVKLSIEYLETNGEAELFKMIPFTEYRKASGYLDYYIEALKTTI